MFIVTRKHVTCKITTMRNAQHANNKHNMIIDYRTPLFRTLRLSALSALPSLYSFPPSNLITSLMCRGIRSIQACMGFCSSPSHTSHHLNSIRVRYLGAPIRVVFLLSQFQHGSIAFKSGEFPGYLNRLILNSLNMCS